MQVRGLKGLTDKLSERDMIELQRRMGEDNIQGLYEGYVIWGKSLVPTLDRMVTELVEEVVEAAREQGLTVKAVEHSGYYPYFYIYQKGNGKWKLVKQDELESFLKQFLNGEKILRLMTLAEKRNNAKILFNHMHRTLLNLGVIVEGEE